MTSTVLAYACVAKRKYQPVIFIRTEAETKAAWEAATDGRNIPQNRAGETLVKWFLRQPLDKQLEVMGVRPQVVIGRTVEVDAAPPKSLQHGKRQRKQAE